MFVPLQPSIKKEGSDVTSNKDDIFAAWKGRKESVNPPAGSMTLRSDGAVGRRKSNLRDINQHLGQLRNVAGLRRMTLSMRAKSDISADLIKPQVKKENTYKMTPDDGTQFSCPKVKQSINSLFEDELSDLDYDHDISSKLACELSEKVKDRMKEMNFMRHKIAVNVMVGQAADQGMEVASRCVWDHKTDNSVCITYRNKNLFVIALIFGVYYE